MRQLFFLAVLVAIALTALGIGMAIHYEGKASAEIHYSADRGDYADYADDPESI